MPDTVKICLIGGTGRCGTTILKTVMAGHPDVAVTPSWRFTIDPDGLVDFYRSLSNNWSPYLFDVKLRRLKNLLNRISSSSLLTRTLLHANRLLQLERLIGRKLLPPMAEHHASRLCPQFTKLSEQLLAELVTLQYRGFWTGGSLFQKSMHFAGYCKPAELSIPMGNFYRAVATAVTDNTNKSYFIDDNTWNILFFDALLELLPDAKLVHIYRDPRDVAASFLGQSWTPDHPEYACNFYAEIMARWSEVKSSVPPDSFMETSLEQLVSETEETLHRICKFWEIPYHTTLLKTDLSKSNQGRWQSSPINNDRYLNILQPWVDKLGY